MHSLKNTIVAVGLLGLSFLFYQASTKPNPNAHLADQIPPLSITDGTDGFSKLTTDTVESGIGAIKSKFENISEIEMPDLSKPKQMVSDMASNLSSHANNFSNQVTEKAAQLKETVNSELSDIQLNMPELSMPNINAPQLEAPQIDAPQFDAVKLEAPAPTQLEFNAPTAQTAQTNLSLAPTQRQAIEHELMDNNTRDNGLIAALKSQARQSLTQPAGETGEFQFASNSIPSNDSSFNRLATDSRDVGSDSNVFQANVSDMTPQISFEAAWSRVDQLVAAEDFAGALRLLSKYYRSSEIVGPQRKRLNGWLDALAGKVIFSTEHHLGQPFTVGNESLTDISNRWGVPAQLIYNINKSKITNPAFVDSGTELKLVRGPFNCEIDMSNNVMTLFLNDMYAGRYPVKIGISGNPSPGKYRVLAKSVAGHSWRDASGKEYPPGSPQNGYGPNWIGLSGSLCIHAVANSASTTHTGCIGLSSKDSKDVFGILSKSSSVTILR